MLGRSSLGRRTCTHAGILFCGCRFLFFFRGPQGTLWNISEIVASFLAELEVVMRLSCLFNHCAVL